MWIHLINIREVDFSLIYLDYAATTPIDDNVLDVYVKASQKYYGNSRSLHDIGSEADEVLTVCRRELAKLINGEKEGIYFTSSGSESNILAIRSLIDGNKSKGNHIITTDVEHSSVYNLFKQLEGEGFKVTYLRVDSFGNININKLKNVIQADTILVSIHHGNPEIGTIQNIKEIGQLLKRHDIIFHADCVQTFGEVMIDVMACHIDSLSISGHKIYGPKGIGACYINPQVNWKAQNKGTTHEKGFRPGTVDVPSIVAFVSAAQIMVDKAEARNATFQDLRDYFLKRLLEINHDIKVYGHLINQLPSIIGMTISGVQGQYVMLECNRNGIAISTGSACQVGQQSPSRTMLSMGQNEDEAKQFIRISFGIHTNKKEIDKLINVFHHLTKNL